MSEGWADYPNMSPQYRKLICLHEAAHAVSHTILAKTCCTEVQTGGSGPYWEAFTFSLTDNKDPPVPMVIAVAVLAGPVSNALFPSLDAVEERKWLARGSLGDHAKAV